MAFTIDVRDRGRISTIVLAGELDMATAPHLQSVVDKLATDGRSCILIDLYDLAFCDSAGLNTFVQGDKHCTARGGWLRLTRARGHVARVMELSGLSEVLGYRLDSDKSIDDIDGGR